MRVLPQLAGLLAAVLMLARAPPAPADAPQPSDYGAGLAATVDEAHLHEVQLPVQLAHFRARVAVQCRRIAELEAAAKAATAAAPDQLGAR